ncbi:DUF2382 domain-containing protein [Sandaracinus amylolyticus]|uniref:DUF2382 domain-containing protein n=1 Tax=Sandaracinus amylolyticus TaxID=927083 RepID=A0A0F6YFF5_9BACT|nr:DUF2382 domain-containing protein [Sandaracinus amylolyticus]AKF03601.1 hypothetical protein DB32_000750 [Sandaracinus amylolyticus]
MPTPPQREGDVVIPVVDERAEIERRLVDTAEVHVRKRVTERVEQVVPDGFREEVAIERVAVDRYVDVAPGDRMEGDVLVVPIVEEVVVVQKRLVLREELHIRKRRVPIESAPQEVVLRREDVEIERVPLDASTRKAD